MNHAILMSSGAENIDFMIHGIVRVSIFRTQSLDYDITCLHIDRYASYDGACHCRKPGDQTCKGDPRGISECYRADGRNAG